MDRLESQIGVGSGPSQSQGLEILFGDQDPVWFDVAVAPTFPFTVKGMISVLPGQKLMGPQGPYDRMELFLGLAALFLESQIAITTRCCAQMKRRRRKTFLGLSLCQSRYPVF
jgi:hypothetical protein